MTPSITAVRPSLSQRVEDAALLATTSARRARVALSPGLALLISIGFTTGLCWLISSVARPIVELPSPRIADTPSPAWTLRPDAGAAVATSFAQPSPARAIEPVAATDPIRLALHDAAADDPHSDEEVVLPPLRYQEEPLALADAAAPLVRVAAGTNTANHIEGTLASSEPAADGSAPESLSNGGLALASDANPTAESDALPTGTTYVVKRGDSLTKILRRTYGQATPALFELVLAANPQVRPRKNTLYAGESLHLPLQVTSGAVVASAALPGRASDGTRRADAGSANVVSAVERDRSGSATRANHPAQVHETSASAATPATRWYIVQKQDSLVKIARRLLNDENRWREIQRLNNLKNADHIQAGRRIRIPVSAEAL